MVFIFLSDLLHLVWESLVASTTLIEDILAVLHSVENKQERKVLKAKQFGSKLLESFVKEPVVAWLMSKFLAVSWWEAVRFLVYSKVTVFKSKKLYVILSLKEYTIL